MSQKTDAALSKMREICLSLPDTRETLTWGHPHFRVGEKIFAGYGAEKGKASIGFKLELDHADALVMNDARFTRAPYVGHKGWVSMDPTGIADWEEVRELIFESYRLIAPKRTVARLLSAEKSAKPAEPAAKKPVIKRKSKSEAVITRKTAEKPAKKPDKGRIKLI